MNLFLTENDACKHHVRPIQQKRPEQIRIITATTVHEGTSYLWNVMLRHFASTIAMATARSLAPHLSYPGHQKVKVKGHDP